MTRNLFKSLTRLPRNSKLFQNQFELKTGEQHFPESACRENSDFYPILMPLSKCSDLMTRLEQESNLDFRDHISKRGTLWNADRTNIIDIACIPYFNQTQTKPTRVGSCTGLNLTPQSIIRKAGKNICDSSIETSVGSVYMQCLEPCALAQTLQLVFNEQFKSKVGKITSRPEALRSGAQPTLSK